MHLLFNDIPGIWSHLYNNVLYFDIIFVKILYYCINISITLYVYEYNEECMIMLYIIILSYMNFVICRLHRVTACLMETLLTSVLRH